MSDEIRGISKIHEQAASKLARDTRPLGQRFGEFLSSPSTVFVSSFSGVTICLIFPVVADLTFLICSFLFLYAYSAKSSLPFKMPMSSKSFDYNDPMPGSNKPKLGQGISFFGNDRVNNEELWFSNEDLRTHILIFGSTGSGKTEFLVSLAYNSLIHASGFIYIDGKGDNSLFAKIFSMVRSMGRDDDMLLVNFMTGARDILGPQETKISNTMNPFAHGSSSMVTNLVVSLMDSGGEGGNSDMWKGRAINFVESLMKILCYMRDQGHILLDANTIREYFSLERLETIVVDRKFPIFNPDSKVDISDVPSLIMDPIRTYVMNLPGYNAKNKGRQAGEVLEQHGFITMQLTRVFGSLADAYGHILRTNLAEVDLKDVVLNRRILVVLLPALEKSPDELSNLGKIIIASLKAMMAAGLGDIVEGDYRDVISRKPTNSPAPYVCIMDEYGYYAVKGFAVVPAQARSLGFSAVFAGQDLPAFQKASKEEAASIGANCNIKICMKLEDPNETWEFFNKVAGESFITTVSGFQQNSGSLVANYADTRNASVDKRHRIDLLDLRDQRMGQAHIFFKSDIIRMKAFFANPEPVKQMRLTQFLKVEAPAPQFLIEIEQRSRLFKAVLIDEKYKVMQPQVVHDIRILENCFENVQSSSQEERAVTALVKILENEAIKQNQINQEFDAIEKFSTEASIFTNVATSELTLSLINPEDKNMFQLPLLRRASTIEEIKNIERMSGRPLSESEKVAKHIVNMLESITKFPPSDSITEFNKNKTIDSLKVLMLLLGGDDRYPGAGITSPVKPGEERDLEKYSVPDLPDLPDLDELQRMFSSETDDE